MDFCKFSVQNPELLQLFIPAAPESFPSTAFLGWVLYLLLREAVEEGELRGLLVELRDAALGRGDLVVLREEELPRLGADLPTSSTV